jgi:hypothetical protein
MRIVRVLGVLGFVFSMAACARPMIGELRSAGFVHDSEKYSIGYADPSNHGILSADWKLENGQPPKDEDLYYKVQVFPKWQFDTNADGTADAFVDVPSADLRFVHLKHGGVIFLRSIPLDVYEEDLDLDVIAEQLAQGMSGTHWYAFGIGGNESVGVERRSAVLIERTQSVTVSQAAGTAVTYSFADVDQLQMSPASRTGKMELVLLRPGVDFSLDRWSGRKPKEWQSQMMLLVGYWNVPARFEQGYADFDALLGRISFTGRPTGLQRGQVIAVSAAEPGVSPEAASVLEPAPASAPASADPYGAPAPIAP